MKIGKAVLVAGCMLALSAASHADSSWLKGSPEEQLKSLAELQPGLGTIMIEYSRRFTTMYYAAHGGNWGMADYQLKEMREIQEVGETTRPGRAQMLKTFESDNLDKLAETIKAKNLKKFDATFKETVTACNSCHAVNKFEFIKYQLPKVSPSPTSNRP
ncbi:MAG TPA: hypothetical protein VKD22_13140 [Ramlibacter sp.]|nr:hypothetical protein [Ramlibacter sp.]